MMEKVLEKKVQVIPNEEFGIPLNKDFELEYYLLESQISDMEELAGKRVYGIEIIKKQNNMSIESNIIKDLCCCKENVQSILSKLASNSVTPIGLSFVIDDLLGT